MTTPDRQRVIDDITERIASGELRPGAKLPTIVELAAQYETSTTTVKNAMLLLRTTGWVRGHPGKATYVADHPPAG